MQKATQEVRVVTENPQSGLSVPGTAPGFYGARSPILSITREPGPANLLISLVRT